MTRDELEFQISQYLDGTLGEAEQSALEARLASDVEARASLDQYRRLDVALKAAPVPTVDWDALSSRISAEVADQADEPAHTYRIGFFRTMAGLALAACVLIGIGLGFRLLQQSHNGRGDGMAVKPTRPAVEIVVVDAAPAQPAPSTAPVEGLAVGPSSTFQDRPGFAGYNDDLLARRSQVFIARSGEPLHDGSFLP